MISIIDSLIEKIINNRILRFDEKEIPKNVFGVFVTIKRSKKDQIVDYLYDVHGCIGYWNTEYSVLDNKTIIEKMYNVGYKAYYEDSRKKYFYGLASNNPETLFEIIFMLKPENGIIIINDNGIMSNGKEFNNREYGIIVENKLIGNRATYLPEVFPDKSWKYIRESLLDKAGINSNENIIFYAYEANIIKKTIGEHKKIFQSGGIYYENEKLYYKQKAKKYKNKYLEEKNRKKIF